MTYTDLGFIGLIITFTISIAVGLSCNPKIEAAKRAKYSIDLIEYQHMLIECREEGKDAGSYWVYEKCAQEADKRLGLDGGK